MPFTIAHVAAVLPFQRRAGFLTLPLVAGSMAPDLAMATGVPGFYGWTHSLLGIVTVDLAITAVLAALWVWWAGEPVLALLPELLRSRLPQRPAVPSFDPEAIAWWLASAGTGSATHVFLDLFTHDNRAGALWSVLAQTVGPWTLAHWTQYLLGFLGILLLVLYAARWARRTPQRPQPLVDPPHEWTVFAGLLLAGSVALAAVARSVQHLDGEDRGMRLLGQDTPITVQPAFGLVAGTLLAAVLLGASWRLLQSGRERPKSRLAEEDEPHQVEGSQRR